MPEHIGVFLIGTDAETRSWLGQALAAPDFQITAYADAATVLAARDEHRPRLVLMDAASALADSRVLRALREGDPPAVLIALAAPGANVAIGPLLDSGLDDVLSLPLDAATLRAKLQAALRLLGLGLATRKTRGALGPDGALGLIKHCEDHRLSGRLTVESHAQRYWVDFFGGELLSTGTDAITSEGDDLAALMSLREGSYVFVQTAVEPLSPGSTLAASAPPVAEQDDARVLSPPEPMVTVVQGTPQQAGYEVRTQGENRPAFTITTSVLQSGRLVRETETAWPHPIESESDLAQARVQMGQQHERVTAKLREVAEPRLIAAPVPAMTSGVDGTLLSWALHFVVEQAWADLGTTVTANLLGRTQSALRRKWPHLAHFRIGDKAQVTFDLSHGSTLASDAVDAIANWLAAFLYLARRVAPDISKINVRQSTLLMATALKHVGFYEAFGAAAERYERDGVQLKGLPIEHGPERARLDYALAAGGSEQASRSNSS